MDNNNQFLLYDKYDIWLVDANGKEPSTQLTHGRNSKMIYRFVETYNERKTLAKNATILIKGFSEIDKSELLSTLNLSNNAMFLINQLRL